MNDPLCRALSTAHLTHCLGQLHSKATTCRERPRTAGGRPWQPCGRCGSASRHLRLGTRPWFRCIWGAQGRPKYTLSGHRTLVAHPRRLQCNSSAVSRRMRNQTDKVATRPNNLCSGSITRPRSSHTRSANEQLRITSPKSSQLRTALQGQLLRVSQ